MKPGDPAPDADLLDGEVTSDSSGAHSIDGDATGRALVKKLYTGLSSRSATLRDCLAVYERLRADSRAHSLHTTPLWALVPGLVLLAGLRLMLFSGELGASMVSITNLSDPAAGTIRMGINLSRPEGWSEDEIDAMTDEFMRRPDLQKWFLGYYVQCAKVLANGPALLASLLDDYPDLAAHLKGSAVAD